MSVRPQPPPAVLAAVVGPTASGKSALASALARRLDAELVSVDSMQVYRGMDIGTAKPDARERAAVAHHLLDLVGPDEEFAVTDFQSACGQALAGIASRGGRAVLVGGTGLYFQAAVDGFTIPGRFPEVRHALEQEPDTAALHERLRRLDPVAAARMEPGNRRRIVRALEVTEGSGRRFSEFGPGVDAFPTQPFPVLALRHARPDLETRIGARLRHQLAAGFLDEVVAIRNGPGFGRTAGQALGYRELLAHLDGATDLADAVALTALRTRQFAVRQERWFRRDPRVVWLDPAGGPADLLDAALTRIEAAAATAGTGAENRGPTS